MPSAAEMGLNKKDLGIEEDESQPDFDMNGDPSTLVNQMLERYGLTPNLDVAAVFRTDDKAIQMTGGRKELAQRLYNLMENVTDEDQKLERYNMWLTQVKKARASTVN